jgi:hypothetical protein
MEGNPSRPPAPASLTRVTPGLDRAALERVLARAAELQSESGEPAEALSEEQILELGTEVGLSPQHLRQALAEERTRVAAADAPSGLLARAVGPAVVSSSRMVHGTAAATLEQLNQWMQREECLQVKRLFPDRIVWEARRGFFDALRRGLNVGGRDYVLSRAHDVSATVVPIDAERALVRLDADFSSHRSAVVGQGATLLGLGAVSSGAAVLLHILLPVAVVPAVAAGAVGYFQARSRHSRTVARAQLALEQVLDRLERGELPRPTLLGALAAAAALPRGRR